MGDLRERFRRDERWIRMGAVVMREDVCSRQMVVKVETGLEDAGTMEWTETIGNVNYGEG